MRFLYVVLILPVLICVDLWLWTTYAQTQSSASTQPYIYTGAGSCAASNCHGSATPKSPSEKIQIRQSEHTHWLTKDKHAKAYDVLLKTRPVKMASSLNLPEPPEKSAKCLDCHALYAVGAAGTILPDRRRRQL